MKPFRRHTGRVAVLDRPDVDTDQIIPKQFLKRIERTGYGEFLFYDWMQQPGFELRRPEFTGASILLAGRNFGCGSSREHAVWALQDYGFAVVVAPSYGDIFRTNAAKIGLVAVELPEREVKALIDSVVLDGGFELTVDLELGTVTATDGREMAFDFDETTRQRLLEGLDEIAVTLRYEDDLAAYEARRGQTPSGSVPSA